MTPANTLSPRGRAIAEKIYDRRTAGVADIEDDPVILRSIVPRYKHLAETYTQAAKIMEAAQKIRNQAIDQKQLKRLTDSYEVLNSLANFLHQQNHYVPRAEVDDIRRRLQQVKDADHKAITLDQPR